MNLNQCRPYYLLQYKQVPTVMQSSSLNLTFYQTNPDNAEPPTLQLRNNRITEQQEKKHKNVKKRR